MKAAVVRQFGGPLSIDSSFPDPVCGPRDVILKVEACGVCRSDYTIWNGGIEWLGLVPGLPLVLGHEYAGIVEEAGAEVTTVRKGDRVVGPFGHACGACECCRDGRQNVCGAIQLPMMHYSGGFAQYTKVANADVNLVHLPASVSFKDAASLGCRYVTSFRGLVDRAQVKGGEWVAVFACGGVGLAAVQIATALGASVIAVSRNAEKLALAKSLGAVHTLTAGADNPAQIAELTGGGAHVSVDALGAAETAIPALLSTRAGGRNLRLGVSNKRDNGQVSLPVDVITFREINVMGSFGMQAARFPDMLRMIETGKLAPGRLVGDTIALEQAGDVLASMTSYDTVAMSVITSM